MMIQDGSVNSLPMPKDKNCIEIPTSSPPMRECGDPRFQGDAVSGIVDNKEFQKNTTHAKGITALPAIAIIRFMTLI